MSPPIHTRRDQLREREEALRRLDDVTILSRFGVENHTVEELRALIERRTREQRDALVALRTWQCAVSPVPRSFFYTPPRFPFQLSARVD